MQKVLRMKILGENVKSTSIRAVFEVVLAKYLGGDFFNTQITITFAIRNPGFLRAVRSIMEKTD